MLLRRKINLEGLLKGRDYLVGKKYI